MREPILVQVLNMNQTDIEIFDIGDGDTKLTGEKIHVILDEDWKVFDSVKEPVTGLLRQLIKDYCDRTFNKTQFTMEEKVHYFLLQEKENGS